MREAVWRVTANGQDVASALNPRLLSLDVRDEAGVESDTCTIILSDLSAEFALPAKGTVLEVALGWAPVPVEMGRFVIDELSISGPPDTIRITASAANFLASLKQRKSRDWHETSLSELVETIAGEHGLTPAIAAEYSGFTIDHLDQVEESDLHLLTRLAEQHGAIAKPVEKMLTFVPRGTGDDASGVALASASIQESELTRWELTTPGRAVYSSVSARWRDAEASLTNTVVVLSEEGDGPEKRLGRIFHSEADAKAAAEAELKAVKLNEARLRITLSGRPEIFAQAPIILDHRRPDLAGAWVVASVSHRMNSSGFFTDIEATRKP
tara:strand:- start:2027 stop:3004 length:978 start_codon:yes stop_codon:yes gene_type:complete